MYYAGEPSSRNLQSEPTMRRPCLSFDFGISVSLGPFTILVLVITLLACCNRAGRHTPGPTRLSSGENYTFSDPKVCRARARARAIL